MTCDRCEQLAAQLGQVERERDAENAAAYRNASHASRAEDVAHVALARVKELEAERGDVWIERESAVAQLDELRIAIEPHCRDDETRPGFVNRVAAENDTLRADMAKANEEVGRLRGMLKGYEWAGYDLESSERACPCCDAWEYKRIHAFACSLGMELGSECEGDTTTR